MNFLLSVLMIFLLSVLMIFTICHLLFYGTLLYVFFKKYVVASSKIECLHYILIQKTMAASSNNNNNYEQEVDLWKLKRVIRNLDMFKGNGTSLITLSIPGGDQVHAYRAMLNNELGTASNIKSRVNRQSVITAITTALQKLKLYEKAPPNGLVVYTGLIINPDTGKEKKVCIDFEPFKPIYKYYKCDNVFHTEILAELLESNTTYGFIIVGGDKTLFGTLNGSNRSVLSEIHGDIPNKTRRGGQSSARYGRLRKEAIHRYVSNLCDVATQQFIVNDKPNIVNIIIAGSGELKNDFMNNDHFDPRLKKLVTKIIDISYTGISGFNQAIQLSSESLDDLQYVKEKRLITEYMDELAVIGLNGCKICYGIKDTIYAMEVGAISKLIVWEDLDIVRYTTATQEIIYGTSSHTSSNLEIIDEVMFTDWIAEHYKKYGVQLYFISDKTTEGNQFCKGFGGIGAILRYNLDFDVQPDNELSYDSVDELLDGL